MEILKLARSEKNGDKFVAEFEDGRRLSVSVAQIADFSLFTGRQLDDGEYESLIKSVEAQSAKARALRILGQRSLSRREITDKLVEKGESEQTAEETADWLDSIGAVNDHEYALMIVRHYAAKGYGRAKIRSELYRRGIERELWEDVLSEMPETDEKVYALLKSKLNGKTPDKAALKKATDSLFRRGYSWDEIKPATERYINETEGSFDEE